MQGGKIKAETGQQSPRQRPDGDRRSDDGKPKTHIMYSRTTQGGETVEEIRKTKIKEAMKEILNVYEKLDLNMTEIEIVSRSQNVAAKVTIAKKQLETEAEERLEEQQTPMKIKIIKWMPAICSTLAIILSIISLILRLYR